MEEKIRRVVAYQAISKITGKESGSIYSYDRSNYSNMSNNYDFESGEHISSSNSGFYHHGSSAHVDLKVEGSNFSGYDYSTNTHFSGSVNGSSVQLYDYGLSEYFSYSA